MAVKQQSRPSLNVLGTGLELCSSDPMTGFHRDGCCRSGPDDPGVHAVCARMTAAFLAFSKSRGNDLTQPRPEFGFPGLRPGDHWCIGAQRWREALAAGVAPPIVLGATHESALRIVPLAELKKHALDLV